MRYITRNILLKILYKEFGNLWEIVNLRKYSDFFLVLSPKSNKNYFQRKIFCYIHIKSYKKIDLALPI